MAVFLLVLIVIVCIILSLIVLIQNPKGGGLDSSFSSANQIGGVKRTADFLEKGTWTLTIALFVLCLLSAGFDNTAQLENQRFQEDPSLLQSPVQQTQENAEGVPNDALPE